MDLIGPIPLATRREEYLAPVLGDARHGDGVKPAFQQVFDTAAKSQAS